MRCLFQVTLSVREMSQPFFFISLSDSLVATATNQINTKNIKMVILDHGSTELCAFGDVV